MLFSQKVQTVGSISDFLNNESSNKEKKLDAKKLTTIGTLPIMLSIPSLSLAAEQGTVADWARGELYEKVVHAFEPVVGLVQALSYPIGLVVMLGGGLFVMIGNREKGFTLIQQAGIGYLLVQSLPMLMDLLVEIAKSI
ncbi:hypothetical protein [uncultured Metabacillus sp.]|uniref:hypothetical protein n=1 Tax=uncultured Metabacillus sp. TaxID=2860135 RepID=UPI0026233D95|nr:hypothetical protein [uncultured Metabacillus sp.]